MSPNPFSLLFLEEKAPKTSLVTAEMCHMITI